MAQPNDRHRPDADDLAGFPTAPMDDLADRADPPWSFGLVIGHVAGLLFLALSAGWIVDSLTN